MAEESGQVGNREVDAASPNKDANTSGRVLRYDRLGVLHRGGEAREPKLHLADLAELRLGRRRPDEPTQGQPGRSGGAHQASERVPRTPLVRLELNFTGRQVITSWRIKPLWVGECAYPMFRPAHLSRELRGFPSLGHQAPWGWLAAAG